MWSLIRLHVEYVGDSKDLQYFHNCKGSVGKDDDEFDVGGDMHLEDNCNDQIQKSNDGMVSKEVTEDLHKLMCN